MDKIILIDDVTKDPYTTKSTEILLDNGQLYKGYFISKPLNYEKGFLSFRTKITMIKNIIKNKAIAVSYFSDLNNKEQIYYANKQLKQNNKIK